MKKSAVVISAALIMLVVLAWVVQMGNIAGNQSLYAVSLKQAEAYRSEGLFQKAIDSYEQALAVKENLGVRTAWLETNKLAYQDGVLTAKELGKAFAAACDLYPEETVFWEQLLSHYVDINSYASAYDALAKCSRANVVSDQLTVLSNQIRYSFTLTRKAYTTYSRSPEGYYTVNDGEGWGVVSPAGERIMDCDYEYISPYSADGFAVYVSEKGNRLVSEDGVVEAIFAENVTQTGAYASGLIPMCTQSGSWRYLNCKTGSYELDTYEAASSFVDGIAAVRENGKWVLVDLNNELVCQTEFDDIKLHGNGDYVYEGIMIASVNGKYGIYDAKGNPVGDFICKDMDVYLGEYIAYCDDSGKWGFVDKGGKTVIEPAFAGAESFSNGLAGVRVADKWGYIDKTSAVVISCEYMDVDYFSSQGSTLVSTAEGSYNVMKLRFV